MIPPAYLLCNNHCPNFKPAKALRQLMVKVLGGIGMNPAAQHHELPNLAPPHKTTLALLAIFFLFFTTSLTLRAQDGGLGSIECPPSQHWDHYLQDCIEVPIPEPHQPISEPHHLISEPCVIRTFFKNVETNYVESGWVPFKNENEGAIVPVYKRLEVQNNETQNVTMTGSHYITFYKTNSFGYPYLDELKQGNSTSTEILQKSASYTLIYSPPLKNIKRSQGS